MKRYLLPFAFVVASVAAIGCDKPTEVQCRKAVENIRRVTGTSQSEFGADQQAAIRSCRGNASKESVLCMMDATSVEDLSKCEGDKGSTFFEDEEKAEQKRRKEWDEKQKEKQKDKEKEAEGE